jgi:hypothetical protein
MEHFAQVKPVLATDRAATTGTYDNFIKVIYAFKRTIGYFHSGGRDVPFLLLRKRFSLRK